MHFTTAVKSFHNRACVAVIGGGPSGYFSAITAARRLQTQQNNDKDNNKTSADIIGYDCDRSSSRRRKVVILEATTKPLRKVLQSGGGRCNVLHQTMSTPSQLSLNHYPRGGREMIGPFTTGFGQEDAWRWFEQGEGLDLKIESDGRVFPKSDDAQSVVDVLRGAAERAGVELYTAAKVLSVKHCSLTDDAKFNIDVEMKKIAHNDDKKSDLERVKSTLRCDAVILATGSSPSGYAIAKSLGVEVASPYPSLFSFRFMTTNDRKTDVTNPFLDLHGISIPDVQLSLIFHDDTHHQKSIPNKNNSRKEKTTRSKNTKFTQRGNLLITHRGLSGPAALRLSSFAAQQLHQSKYRGTILVNFVPDFTSEEVYQALYQYSSLPDVRKKNVATAPRRERKTDIYFPSESSQLLPELPKRLWSALVTTSNINQNTKWSQLSKIQLKSLSETLTSLPVKFKGKDTNKEEFVTAGGIVLSGVDLKKMESKKISGLHFVGEVLNVDGVTGGFNFQHCWSSGYIAGNAAAEEIISIEGLSEEGGFVEPIY